MPALYRTLVFLLTFLPSILIAQLSSSSASSGSGGYAGYNLTLDGDPEDTSYDTASTSSGVNTSYPEPDVYLNASVHVGEIDITVQNLTAKINLDAQVLNLLKFNAGVDLSIDRVELLIQNVTAKVLLEARLENLVAMIDDILQSLDLNPVLVSLGNAVDNITTTAVGALNDTTSNLKRNVPLSYDLAHNVLYSSNNYQGQTHTNRILTQTGSIVDQYLDNDGNIQKQVVVGSYLKDMTFNGENNTVTRDGRAVQQLEFVYEPFRGLSVVSWIYILAGEVVATQVFSEAYGGGTSTIGD